MPQHIVSVEADKVNQAVQYLHRPAGLESEYSSLGGS